jgi:hypothetical protein
MSETLAVSIFKAQRLNKPTKKLRANLGYDVRFPCKKQVAGIAKQCLTYCNGWWGSGNWFYVLTDALDSSVLMDIPHM